MELIRLVGTTPHLVISDSASTEIKGEVKRLINCFNIIFNRANKEKLDSYYIKLNVPSGQLENQKKAIHSHHYTNSFYHTTIHHT